MNQNLPTSPVHLFGHNLPNWTICTAGIRLTQILLLFTIDFQCHGAIGKSIPSSSFSCCDDCLFALQHLSQCSTSTTSNQLLLFLIGTCTIPIHESTSTSVTDRFTTCNCCGTSSRREVEINLKLTTHGSFYLMQHLALLLLFHQLNL